MMKINTWNVQLWANYIDPLDPEGIMTEHL